MFENRYNDLTIEDLKQLLIEVEIEIYYAEKLMGEEE